MRSLTRLMNLLPGRRRAMEADVIEELEALRHLSDPEERRELGNLTRAAENAREEWSWPWLEQIGRDLRMAFRSLRRSPGYVAASVLILALGIGANTAIFSVVHAVILKPLPYPDADRLVFIWGKLPTLPFPIGDRLVVPRSTYQEWQKHSELFDAIGAFQEARLNEGGVEKPRSLSTLYVSSAFCPCWERGPARGAYFATTRRSRGRIGLSFCRTNTLNSASIVTHWRSEGRSHWRAWTIR